jgi:hypothetical protein
MTDLPAGNFAMHIDLISHLTTGNSYFQATGDITTTQVFANGSSYPGFGLMVANTSALRGANSGGLILMADDPAGTVRVVVGSNSNLAATWTAAGKYLLTASTTTRASFNIPSGTAPTSPVDGDMYQDGTHVFMRVGGAWKQLDN